MIVDEGEYIEHFGVKGMKWGQRKDRSNHGLNARARKAQAVADRRPTRGNIRTAQRAQIAAARSASKKKIGDIAKTQLPGNSNKADVKTLAKMSKGEKAASALLGGPVGMMGFKAGKIVLAKHDLEKSSLEVAMAKKASIKANAKMSSGEKVVTAILGGPVTMLAYKGGKIVGARLAENHKP